MQEVAPALGWPPARPHITREGAGVTPAQSWDLSHPNLMDRSGLTLLQASVVLPGEGRNLVTKDWNWDPWGLWPTLATLRLTGHSEPHMTIQLRSP